MPNNIVTPVSRNHKFYSEADFQYETELMADYIEGDLGMSVVVYRVDRERTLSDVTYRETGRVFYKMPVEVHCIYTIEESRLKSYDAKTANGAYTIAGSLKFDVLVRTLEELDCDISRGDYIGVLAESGRMTYFVVIDDGKLNVDNRKHIGAYRPAWRSVVASPVTDLEFKG